MAKSSSVFSRFVKAEAPVKQRIIGASYGEPGSGKTTFWLGAPGPIVIQSLDQGLEGVVEPFQKDKDIYIAEYDWSTLDKADEALWEVAKTLRDQFTEDFKHAIQHARTVIWDKETDVWGLFRYAEFGPEEAGRPKDWEALKARLRTLINMPKALDINFGMVQGMKNEWVSSVNKKTGTKGITQSGNRLRAGMDDVESLVHINIEHVRENGEFSLRVGKARGPGAHDIQDKELPGLTFVEFATLAFPDSTEEDWK